MSKPWTTSEHYVNETINWIIICFVIWSVGNRIGKLEKRIDALESQATQSQAR